ncbi:hypothetical protein DSL72_009230 [Monilinia vaccinii-corymbosi]|uniref:Uncharacterized protein n=1 Tax=Monilinia vaccinii-corymbosi TaxID=61207 RepID=A0A8A3PNS6_9HELO|nr:hypothetical protein DSL72_009230 [Monilinia vaccinii-corymbosi]
MGWFGSQDLSAKFGMILGGLIVIVFAAAFIKVWQNKRRLAKNTKIEELERASSTREKPNIEDLGEGDLFGVRAIERGFFGGVSQSRSNSPAQSMYASNSSIDSSSRRSSKISVPKSTMQKPIPLRLQPSDAEIRRSTMTNTGGSYIPPPPTIKDTQPQSNSSGGHHGGPSIVESNPMRTKSDDEMSQFQSEGEVPRNYQFLAGQHSSVRSQAGSIYGSADPSSAGVPEMPTAPIPTHVLGLPQHPQRSQSRSPSPEESRSHESSPPPDFPIPPIPPPHKQTYQPTALPANPGTNHKPHTYAPLSRFNDSIRPPHQPSAAPEHRLSKDRDQMIYDDPSARPTARNSSGRVQGCAVDSDRPRESPFSNANAIVAGSGESFSSASSASVSVGEGQGHANDVDWNGGRMRRRSIVDALTLQKSAGGRSDASQMV